MDWRPAEAGDAAKRSDGQRQIAGLDGQPADGLNLPRHPIGQGRFDRFEL